MLAFLARGGVGVHGHAFSHYAAASQLELLRCVVSTGLGLRSRTILGVIINKGGILSLFLV